jgi:uncharacterized damage-inducible protein DinB
MPTLAAIVLIDAAKKGAIMYFNTVGEPVDGWSWTKPADVAQSIREQYSALLRAKRSVVAAVSDLPESLLWTRIGPDVSAVGNLLLHLRGSEHQWIADKIGARPLVRDRDAEFAARSGPSLPELLAALQAAGAESHEVIAGFDDDAARNYRSDQGFSISFILTYSAHHYALHLGQIVVVREFLEPGFRLEDRLSGG